MHKQTEIVDLIVEAGQLLGPETWQDIQFIYRPHDLPKEQCTIFVGDQMGSAKCSVDDVKSMLMRSIHKGRKRNLYQSLFRKVGDVV